MDKNNCESVSFKSYFEQYKKDFFHVLGNIDCGQVTAVLSALIEARDTGRNIFALGNGGSAACASHFAVDFQKSACEHSAKPFRIWSLSDNPSVLTALGNDFGFDQIFSAQLKHRLRPGDVVMALSASGNSPNILRGIEYANDNGAVTIGIVGFDGGDLKKLCKYSIHIESQKGEYGHVEDAFMFLDHLITGYLYRLEK